MAAQEIQDLLIMVDATASMSNYLRALQKSLPQILSISALTGCFSRIGVLAYRDYCDDNLLEWSGWLNCDAAPGTAQPNLIAFANNLYADGGGDAPEATKTGLARAYQEMRTEALTILLFYTDAPPHVPANSGPYSNHASELRALNTEGSFGGTGHLFADWVSACRTLRYGEKRAKVFCTLAPWMGGSDWGYYAFLSTITGGACFFLKNENPVTISEVTIGVLLAWMGVEKAGAEEVKLSADMSRYISVDDIKNIQNEEDSTASKFFVAKSYSRSSQSVGSNTTRIQLAGDVMKKHLPKKSSPLQDFAKRYTTDEAYKKIVATQLRKIIEHDVLAISLNPVFGSLWRAVSNDRTNPDRDELISAFGLAVERIDQGEEKQRMKTWLEQSYDYTAEVLELIELVPVDQRFPCVFLDPTLDFAAAPSKDEADEEENDVPITKFRRDELLEIGRSCDYRILRRLGKILTQLTFVNSADQMPAHIASMDDKDVPKIPLALAHSDYKRKFWGILLHVVVPGTMLGPRPATLLAALSLHLGIRPLESAAVQQMLAWRDKWNTLEIPETWNTSCLSLLLDADLAYTKLRDEARPVAEGNPKSLLKPSDRKLFEILVSYKLLEMNMLTTLSAKVGWTPDKTPMAIGPLVICKRCKLPRSVTIMGLNQACGLCLVKDWGSEEVRQKSLARRVSKDDTEASTAIWVECADRTCRGQYVVYNTEALNVRAKCHYCRNQQKAPLLECKKCLNHMIYPDKYRPAGLDVSKFHCVACTVGSPTSIIDVETTADELTKENGTAWLLMNQNQKIAEPFSKRTLFHVISTAGTADFATLVSLFPPTSTPLTLNRKPIHNTPALIAELEPWITRRRTQRSTCSLCFTSHRPADLNAACSRRGCSQPICRTCLSSWYGLNKPGSIINPSALTCPFCRRHPAPKTLTAYGMGIHTVGDLRTALGERGEWIHAWCAQCGFARRFAERACARGAPPEVRGWVCEGCVEENARVAREEAERLETEKAGGCHHMECFCGTHWCWFCGDKQDSATIYEHMDRKHGGMFAGEAGYGSDDDDDY
ncbi:hypothetical protein EJ06DRAFT_478284 [Trichodelitschia bisporula]|uniref:RING-type domain-containing protein n=1 Tax=Trichodelitschia bisporula TaxID=703511 RepID=A0A6G1HUD7_9PEZI|nr:hypothetical protein EJ06DRAFT_478284 [Trichodelitschia bisporula]